MNNRDRKFLRVFIDVVNNYSGALTNQDLLILKGFLRIVNAYEEPMRWITVKGNHIPIFEGEDVGEAVKKFVQGKRTKKLAGEAKKVIRKAISDLNCRSDEPAYRYPKTVAGAVRMKSMSFEEADKGRANPNYSTKNPAYYRNCQSAVVAYEARRRGYDVQAAPRGKNDKTAQLALHPDWAWIDPVTDKKCKFYRIDAKNSEQLYDWLEYNIKSNARYEFGYNWERNGKLMGHVVIIERDSDNNLNLFDPQTGRLYRYNNLTRYLKQFITFSYNNLPVKPYILRIDDKKFNPYFMNNIVKSY